MSDEHPDEEPGTAAPAWAVLPTMPWTRPVPGPRQAEAAASASDGRAAIAPDAPGGARPVPEYRQPGPPPHGNETNRGDRAPQGRAPAGHPRSPGTAPAPSAEPAPGGFRLPPRPRSDHPGPPHTGVPAPRPGAGTVAGYDVPAGREAPARRGTTYGGPPGAGPGEPPALHPDAPPHTPAWPAAGRPESLSDVPPPARASVASPTSAPPAQRQGTAPSRAYAPPISAPPISAPPVSAPPVSAPPVSAPPISGAPASGPWPIAPAPRAAGAGGPAQPVPEKSPSDGEPDAAAAPPAPEPEQLLAGFRWGFDPDTLREVVEGDEADELRRVGELLSAKLEAVADHGPRARLLSLRAVVRRILGDLDAAFADGKLALAHAEATGELRRVAIAQARLAHVLQCRGEFAEADRLFTLANSTELPDRLRATMHQHAGKCAYEQGRYIEACNHFERALELRKAEDPDLISSTELALDAVFRRVAENGWGPYPRSRDEILQVRRPLTPTLDDHTGRWGFIDDFGVFRITPKYSDVQPFRDGVAWVQRPGAQSWELIDDTGRLLIDATAGYLGVASFSDGITWVSRNGATGWIAIDKANAVLIANGFDDVRPFRRGLAAVRRAGRWGAVDGTGRVVVPLRYDGFATALHDGRYIDGFNDEGLAVVSLGAYKGVVDRTGRVIVTPVHPALVIHPVAFLFTDAGQRWGALDRQGRPLLPPRFASRGDVTEEIDRLLADTRPML